MAKKKIDMEDLFQTMPTLPEGFEEWCYSFLPKIPIYYQRKGKKAECQCGKCGKHYVVKEQPSRNEPAKCPYCENEGFYEWKRVTRSKYFEKGLFLMQCTNDENLVVRFFEVDQSYAQGHKADINLTERKRLFLTYGDVFRFNYETWWGYPNYRTLWREGKGNIPMHDGELYAGWRDEIKKSCLKYCDIAEVQKMAPRAKLNILIAFSNNPALEMYVKAGMEELVNHLIWKEGRTKWINRRGKNLKQQLRLKDKQKIKRFIESKGDITLLEILLLEEKYNIHYTEEQRNFLKSRFEGYYNERKQTVYLLKYMTLQQLMNRTKKYLMQPDYYSEHGVITEYYDYLQMREELGYDMTNEVYLHPKNLKEKHDEMVKEKNARADELYITKKLQQFPDIAKRYEKLCKKYNYQSNGYIIRPAKDAGEIIMEGRKLHHCVGGDNYLRKHNEGETVILFLRKEKSPNRPYYTIEIKGNGIIQWYGLKDTKPDKEIIGPWLDRYVESLKSAKKRKLKAAG